MPRGPRWILPGQPVEITTRTLESRMMLPLTPQFQRQVVGILARAAEQNRVQIHAVVMLSNHYHCIVTPEDGEELASFMNVVNSSLARQVLHYRGRSDKLWSRRYSSVSISEEPAAQEERLRYLFAHGVKEDLVERVGDWPGLHCARALMDGKPLKGVWINRTKLNAARHQQRRLIARGQRPKPLNIKDFETEYELELAPLPCWKGLSPTERRQRARELVLEVEKAAEVRRAAEGKSVLGVLAVLKQDPDALPHKTKRSPKPLVHAASKAVRRAYRAAYAEFVKLFRQASDLLRSGDRMAQFPRWSFPPALAFHRTGEEVLLFR